MVGDMCGSYSPADPCTFSNPAFYSSSTILVPGMRSPGPPSTNECVLPTWCLDHLITLSPVRFILYSSVNIGAKKVTKKQLERRGRARGRPPHLE